MVDRTSRSVRGLVVVGILAAASQLGACSSSTFALDDGIPNTAPPAIVVGSRAAPRPMALTKQNSGTYPTFGKPMTAANTQIEDAEATTSEAQLSALASARASGAVTEAEYERRVAELRRLAAEHAADAEKQIAN
ncbi:MULTISPECIES: SHOCT domain-containing protein [unclassified Rhizobium]|uniref:SHOCT domain-containing protein n=1 Tax=unclassified Rhizobium TaxID=2613769 RepID=UPI003D26CED5